jgi:hypothetical protein
MLVLSFSSAFAAAAASDIKGHWAESQISAWMDQGFIKGYEDGSFKSDNTITRAELIALINRSFGYKDEALISFSDIAPSNWAYTEVAKAVKAGYIAGYEDRTIRADKAISRQEVAVIVGRLLNLSAAASAGTSFQDASLIANWARDAVNQAVAGKIMDGYGADNSFKPTNPMTRAEAVVTLDRAISSTKAAAYDKAGTYGPATGLETINKDVVIHTSGVTLQNLIITGNLTFAAGIGNGDVFLNNVTVKGNTFVQGGGVNSIHFKDSVLQTVIVDKKDGPVRIVAEGSTTVQQVNVNSPATIQETGVTGAGFGNVTLTNLLLAGSNVTLKGTFDNLKVVGNGIHVDIPEGTVQKVSAESTSTGMTLNLSKAAKIVSLNLDAQATIQGTGTIDSATLSSVAKAGSIFETQPAKIIDAGATVTPAPTTGSGGGSGAGSESDAPTVPAVPTNLVANSGDSQIKLTWSSVTGATYYQVYQSQNGSSYVLITTPSTVTSSTYTVTGLSNGTKYDFKVAAANTVGESMYAAAVSETPQVKPAIVNLGMAGNYVILTETGVTNVAVSAITGDIGVSPIAATAITGFNLVKDTSNPFSTSAQVTGNVYAADYAAPTPSNLTTAIGNMETAYTDAAGRAAAYTELYSGDISGRTLTAGVYKWSSSVSINSNVTLDGGANDVWIFQIAGGITQASNIRVILTGGAQAKNIFWQAADTVSIGTGAHFEGNILAKTNISLKTGASINGRLLAQTAVTLDQNTVNAPSN